MKWNNKIKIIRKKKKSLSLLCYSPSAPPPMCPRCMNNQWMIKRGMWKIYIYKISTRTQRGRKIGYRVKFLEPRQGGQGVTPDICFHVESMWNLKYRKTRERGVCFLCACLAAVNQSSSPTDLQTHEGTHTHTQTHKTKEGGSKGTGRGMETGRLVRIVVSSGRAAQKIFGPPCHNVLSCHDVDVLHAFVFFPAGKVFRTILSLPCSSSCCWNILTTFVLNHYQFSNLFVDLTYLYL